MEIDEDQLPFYMKQVLQAARDRAVKGDDDAEGAPIPRQLSLGLMHFTGSSCQLQACGSATCDAARLPSCLMSGLSIRSYCGTTDPVQACTMMGRSDGCGILQMQASSRTCWMDPAQKTLLQCAP